MIKVIDKTIEKRFFLRIYFCQKIKEKKLKDNMDNLLVSKHETFFGILILEHHYIKNPKNFSCFLYEFMFEEKIEDTYFEARTNNLVFSMVVRECGGHERSTLFDKPHK